MLRRILLFTTCFLFLLFLVNGIISDPAEVEWGITGSLGTEGVTNWCKAFGGTSPNIDGMKLIKASIYVGDTHGSGYDMRLAVYQGGALDVGPDGATLIYDFGKTSGTSTGTWLHLTHPGAGVSLAKNTVTWVAATGNNFSNFKVTFSENSGDSGDYQDARGVFTSDTMSVDEDTAYLHPWPADGGGFSNYWYAWMLTYSYGEEEENAIFFGINFGGQ